MRRSLFGLLALMIAGCQASYPFELAYASDREGNLDLYLTDTDTAFYTNLTQSPETEYGLAWSSDGQRLLYSMYKEGNSDLYMLDLITGQRRQLTDTPQGENSGAFSPDGSRIAFASQRDSPRGEIYLMNADGSKVERLTQNDLQEGSCAFSPDGNKLLFTRQVTEPPEGEHAGNGELMLLDLPTREEVQLTHAPGYDALGVFSPNGRYIAYHYCVDSACDIMVMGADGGNPQNLTQGEDDSRWPRWSPDGRWIAYTRVVAGNTEIWAVRPDGSGKKPLITSPFRDEIATWRPRKKK